MPLDLQIIRASEFIRLGAQGRLDLATSREILRQLAGACRRRGIDQALLDLRNLHPGPTPMLTRNDLAALVNTFREVGFSDKQRLAVLYSADPHHRARMFAFMSTLKGWNVKASDNFEEALLWLLQWNRAEDRKGADEAMPAHATGMADHLPGRIQPREETGKENQTPPPSGRRRPPSAVSTKAPMKRTPKAGRS